MSDRDVTHAAKDTGVEVVPGLAALTAEHGPLFVVVGVFDGIHRGHLYLLRELQRVAAAHDARPAVITFDAHPDEVLTGKAPPLLCDPDERLARLAAAGVEVTVVQHFDQALRLTSYDGFVGMITSRTKLAGLLMTPDAAFGYERRGTPDALSELGGREGFEVVVVPTFELDGEPVRSADIRAAVAAGDLAGARLLLGRPLAVVGNVTGRHPSSEAGNELVELGFSMPVSLPPPGRYEAKVGPPLTVGEPKAEASVEALCTVSNTTPAVRVECQGELPGTSRLRVAFSD